MATEDNEKLKALKLTIDKLDKTYGKGSVMKLGDNTVEPIETISSGSIGLDLALGVGGYPRGRIVEIFGPESSGKTTLAICFSRNTKGRWHSSFHRCGARI